jgi:hypothetical protein
MFLIIPKLVLYLQETFQYYMAVLFYTMGGSEYKSAAALTGFGIQRPIQGSSGA